MNKVLILIDVQEDFTRGVLRNEEAIKALPVIQKAVQFAKDHHFSGLIYTADTHYDDYLETQEGKNLPVPHCMDDTPGWQICPEVANDDLTAISTMLIKKEAFGTFDWKYWAAINAADEIWMCGFCTDICVSANFQILKAMYPETPIVVIEDACAGVTPELHEAALKVMQSCQAKIMKWDDLEKQEM